MSLTLTRTDEPDRGAEHRHGLLHRLTDQDLSLQAALRHDTWERVEHQCGTQAPGWLLDDLPALTPGERKRVHVWTGIYDTGEQRGLAVHVRLYDGQLSVWRSRFDGATRHHLARRADAPVTSLRQALDLLVALEVLHPRWSSITERLTSHSERGVEECVACDTVVDACPYHRGLERGAQLLAAALQAALDGTANLPETGPDLATLLPAGTAGTGLAQFVSVLAEDLGLIDDDLLQQQAASSRERQC
jgi:hypothetical protein